MCMMWRGFGSQGLVVYVCVGVLVCSSLGCGSGCGWWGPCNLTGVYRVVSMGMYGICDVV